jgi:hypothetical protein
VVYAVIVPCEDPLTKTFPRTSYRYFFQRFFIMKVNGSCLCGVIRFSATLKQKHVDVCHCDMCRKWHGGMGFSVPLTEPPTLLSGKEDGQLSLYQSSEWGQRLFCKTCGSCLFYQAPDYGYYGVVPGVLDEEDQLEEMKLEIFTDQKPSYYYDFAGDTKKMTKAEFLASLESGDCGGEQTE